MKLHCFSLQIEVEDLNIFKYVVFFFFHTHQYTHINDKTLENEKLKPEFCILASKK